MMDFDWNAASKSLSGKLDPKHVRKPNGKFGPKGDYIEGWHAIAEANRIFGHGGWSYTIDLTKEALQEVEKNGKTQWQAAYTCVCTVTVQGTTRQDVGFGSGFAAQIGDAIEGATKEAATDALKRCLRTYGNPFGLALYDKDRENVGIPTNPAEIDRAIANLSTAPDTQALLGVWKSLPRDVQAESDVILAKDEAKAKLEGKAAA